MTLTELMNQIEEILRKNNDKNFAVRVDYYKYPDGRRLSRPVSCCAIDGVTALREVLEYPGKELHLITFDSISYSYEKESFVAEHSTVFASWEIFDSLDEPQARFLKFTRQFNRLMDKASKDDSFGDYHEKFYHLRGAVELYIRNIVNKTPDLYREADDVLVLYDEDLHEEIKKDFQKLADTLELAEMLSGFHRNPIGTKLHYFGDI